MHVTYTIDTRPNYLNRLGISTYKPSGYIVSRRGKLALHFRGSDKKDDIDQCVGGGRRLGALFEAINALSVLTLCDSTHGSISPLEAPLFNVLLTVRLILHENGQQKALSNSISGGVTFHYLNYWAWEWLYTNYLLKDMTPEKEQSRLEFESVCNFFRLCDSDSPLIHTFP